MQSASSTSFSFGGLALPTHGAPQRHRAFRYYSAATAHRLPRAGYPLQSLARVVHAHTVRPECQRAGAPQARKVTAVCLIEEQGKIPTRWM